MIARQRISDNPLLPGIERYVNILGFEDLDVSNKYVRFKYFIEYKSGGQDVTHLMNQHQPQFVIQGEQFDNMGAAFFAEVDKAAGIPIVFGQIIVAADQAGKWNNNGNDW